MILDLEGYQKQITMCTLGTLNQHHTITITNVQRIPIFSTNDCRGRYNYNQ